MTHHLRTVKYDVVVNGLQMNKDKFVKGDSSFVIWRATLQEPQN